MAQNINKTLAAPYVVHLILEAWRSDKEQSPVYFYLFLVNSVAGILANSPICFAFVYARKLRTARNTYIANLAFGNLLMSASLMPCVYLPFTKPYWEYGEWECKFFSSFTSANVYCSSFCTIAIAVDRYYSIRRRNAHQRAYDMLISVIACGVIWILAVLCASPTVILQRVDTPQIALAGLERRLDARVTGLPPNATHLTLKPVCFMDHSFAESAYVFATALRVSLLLPIPVVTITVYNILLHKVLIARSRKLLALTVTHQKRLSRSPKTDHRRITKMLFAMVVMAAVLWCPYNAISIATDHFQEYVQGYATTLQRFDMAVQLFGYASLYLNPLLYGFMNSNYRKELRRLCCCWSNGVLELRARFTPELTLSNVRGYLAAPAVALFRDRSNTFPTRKPTIEVMPNQNSQAITHI